MDPLILAYCDPDSARPGETIRFMVSCEEAQGYRADIVRLRCSDTGTQAPGFSESIVPNAVNGEYPARVQSIPIGSYARVPGRGQLEDLESFTLQAFVMPTRPGAGPQSIMGNWSDDRGGGFGIGLDDAGALVVRVGDGARQQSFSTAEPLDARRWYLVAATFDATSGEVTLHQSSCADHQFPPAASARSGFQCPVKPARGEADLLFAGCQASAGVSEHFDGKIERPRLVRVALSREAIERVAEIAIPADCRTDLIGGWDFSQEIDSDRIVDVSGNALHGETVNLPARAMTGVNWSGETHDWRQTPEHYGAIHFHSDDLYDAGWQSDFELTIPANFASGIYAARLRTSGGAGIGNPDGAAEYYVPFYVRTPAGRPTAKALFLVPTATYMAYANIRGRITSLATDALSGKLTIIDPIDLVMLERTDLGLSTYDAHADGSPVGYSSRLRPVVNHRPKESELTMAYNNLAADLLITDWLDHLGGHYDVMTDEDLHREGLDALREYQVVITGAHPEYHSLAMLDALDGFVRQGGRLMYLGGNGFYWRVAFRDDKPGVLELRRAQVNIGRWNPGPGQYLHSFTGEHGGLWRDLGRAPQLLTGVGFVAQGFDVGAPYRRTAASHEPRAAFIFEGVQTDVIGDFGLMPGGVAGIEVDRYDRRRGSPAHALVVASSAGHSNVYEAFEEMLPGGIDDSTAANRDAVRADMVFFECPNGGAVFSVGSIAYAFGLAHAGYENNVARITGNVLNRFLDPTPFAPPPPSG